MASGRVPKMMRTLGGVGIQVGVFSGAQARYLTAWPFALVLAGINIFLKCRWLGVEALAFSAFGHELAAALPTRSLSWAFNL